MKKHWMMAGALALVLTATIGLTGCPSGTQQQQAAQAAQNVSIVVQGAEQGEIAAYNIGQSCLQAATTDTQKAACIVIPAADHKFIQQQFLTIATLGKTLDSCIKSATNTAGIVACANTATTTVDQLNTQGALYLKSDKAQTIYSGVMTAVKLGIATISTVLGGQQ